MESTLGPQGRVTITGRPLLPAFPALRLGAPDKKLACPPYSILLTQLLPQDTVIFFSFYSSPTQHHGLNSESQEQGSVVAWPKTPKSETTSSRGGESQNAVGPPREALLSPLANADCDSFNIPISEVRRLRLRALLCGTQAGTGDVGLQPRPLGLSKTNASAEASAV